ncbi:5'-AMP-activated protein kinase subunit gamma [Elsinoe fawcettii]|nr:5'-AMP-activated protein kinase subunit gamma [Elsinoe fawcettii]
MSDPSQPAEAPPAQEAQPTNPIPTSSLPSTTPAFVAPSDLLRPRSSHRPGSRGNEPMSQLDHDQANALLKVRSFLKTRRSFDVLPLSYRLIVLDNSLLVKKSLTILQQNAIVSAPLWDSKTSTFAGLLTTSDYLNIIQYYLQYPDQWAVGGEGLRLSSLREVEKAIGVQPIETISINPMKSLYEACKKMLSTRARRIPLVDVDDETAREMVVSVITQYRILKFICVNVKELQFLRKPLKDINLGTYKDVATAKMDTSVFDVIQLLVKKNISSVPIVNDEGVVLNIFEAVDVITLFKDIQSGKNSNEYETNLQISVGDALLRRPEEFQGIYTCTLNDRLDSIFDILRKSRVHRFVVLDEKSHLQGIVTLSDILEYLIISGEQEEH